MIKKQKIREELLEFLLCNCYMHSVWFSVWFSERCTAKPTMALCIWTGRRVIWLHSCRPIIKNSDVNNNGLTACDGALSHSFVIAELVPVAPSLRTFAGSNGLGSIVMHTMCSHNLALVGRGVRPHIFKLYN